MSRSDEHLTVRDAKLAEIKEAFERAGFEVLAERYERMPYSSVRAFHKLGDRRYRQVFVAILDSGDCDVYLTQIYEVPPGKTARNFETSGIPRLFPTLSNATPNLGTEIVQRVQEAISRDG